MRFVDHQRTETVEQRCQDPVTELRVGQPLRRHEEDVDPIVEQQGLDGFPVLGVRGVQADRDETGPRRGGHLVAHQRQQGRDDEDRAGARIPHGARDREVHQALAPARRLHHQGSPPVGGHGTHGRQLVVFGPGVEPREDGLGRRIGGGVADEGGCGHDVILPPSPDNPGDPRTGCGRRAPVHDAGIRPSGRAVPPGRIPAGATSSA